MDHTPHARKMSAQWENYIVCCFTHYLIVSLKPARHLTTMCNASSHSFTIYTCCLDINLFTGLMYTGPQKQGIDRIFDLQAAKKELHPFSSIKFPPISAMVTRSSCIFIYHLIIKPSWKHPKLFQMIF